MIQATGLCQIRLFLVAMETGMTEPPLKNCLGSLEGNLSVGVLVSYCFLEDAASTPQEELCSDPRVERTRRRMSRRRRSGGLPDAH